MPVEGTGEAERVAWGGLCGSPPMSESDRACRGSGRRLGLGLGLGLGSGLGLGLGLGLGSG